MRIVHVVEPLAAGIATFIKSLVENLPEDYHLIVHGERQQVIPFAEVRKQFVYPNVKFLRWKSAQRSLRLNKDIPAFIQLYTILKRLKQSNSLDIVHLHSSKGGFIGRLVCRLLGIQHMVVYTPNGAPFLGNISRASKYLYKRLEKIATIFGGQVVCCSPSEHEAYQKEGIDSITINNGIYYNKTIVPPATKKHTIFRIVTSGRIVHQKNPQLFNTIAEYFEDLKQFEFLWIGDGTERHLLTAKNILVTGWLSKEAIDEYVTGADIYLSAANFEGLPFAVLEALALNKPVLLSDCVGNKDLVMKGLNGAVFHNEKEAINKILHFYNNTSMLSVMGNHSGFHCRASFGELDMNKRYKKLYQSAATNNAAFT